MQALYKCRHILTSFRKNTVFFKMNYQNTTSSEISKRFRSSEKESNLDMDSLQKKCKNLKFQVLPCPVQSENDKKEYKVIKLENGLTACLISDKANLVEETYEIESEHETGSEEEGSEMSMEGSEESEDSGDNGHNTAASAQKMAAAGLCIGVGSFSDPKEVQGMAHFLEHMVFMGSEKFPEENDFDSFIKKGGGSDNASTDAETTCFYFECLDRHLYEALDRFAQFFISPLMKKDAITRERESIDSEFQMALLSDTMRKEQLLCNTAKVESPANSFGWGNLKTLRDNISEDKLYEGVHAFRKRHYSAHRMTLAIQARLPIETLEIFVLDCFSNVANNGLPPEDFTLYKTGVFDTPEFRKLYYIEPNTDLSQLDLTWSLPPLQGKYKTKPHEYVSHLLGDEGVGSLLSYLKKKVWGLATSINSGDSGIETNSMYTLFTVSIVLTDQGFANLLQVIEIVYSYINMLKKIEPQQRVFDEMKIISDTYFKFSSEEPAVDIVEELSEAMQVYPPVDYITGSELYFEYSPTDIKMVLDRLCPLNMNIKVLTKVLPDGLKFDQTEQWFGTSYTYTDIPQSWMKRWESVEPYPEFSIPPPNPYLTTDFSLLPEMPNNPEYPQKVINTNLAELWYKKDQKFKLPLAYYNFYLISPLSVESSKSRVMLDMVLNLLVIITTEELYLATLADLSYSFAVHERGLVVKVSGYNEKLPIIIEVISKYLLTFNDHMREDVFIAVKDKIVKNYHNQLLKPSNLSKEVRLKLLVSHSWTPVDKLTAILDVTMEQVKQFFADFMKSLYIKVLVQGNVTEEVASQTVNKFVNGLQYSQLPENSYPKFRVVQVPSGEKCLRIEGFNKHDTNSIITNYYQSGPFSMKDSMIIEIIMQIIEEPLFDILRTKEQLGYSVYCSVRDTYGVLGYTVTVNTQANKFSTSFVDERIEAFLRHTKKLLREMSQTELDNTKDDLIKTKQCVDVHLKEELDRNWSELVSDDYMFDRLKQEIATIGDIKVEEIREWWEKHNSFGKSEKFRKLSIQISGHSKITDATNAENAESSGKGSGDSILSASKLEFSFLGSEELRIKENKPKDYFLQDIEKFKETLHLYPPVQIFKKGF